MRFIKLIMGIVGGTAAVVLAATVLFALLRYAWPEYAAAEPTKAYALEMLFARLTVGVLSGIAAGSVATIVAGDRGQSALGVAIIFFAQSLWVHLLVVWNDYPVWYHVVYLAYIFPAAMLGAYIARPGKPRAE